MYDLIKWVVVGLVFVFSCVMVVMGVRGKSFSFKTRRFVESQEGEEKLSHDATCYAKKQLEKLKKVQTWFTSKKEVETQKSDGSGSDKVRKSRIDYC